MMLKIRNWEQWQSYRKGRGQPPWIKVHRRLMRDPNWVTLTDAQRGQLVAIWMLAADRHGAIPASAELVRKLCFMDAEPDLNLFIEKGFIEGCHDGANVTPIRRQHDHPEEKRREEKSADYYFESGVIRLNERDFNRWKSAYSNLDLEAELCGLAGWAAEQRNWFNAVAGALTKKNRTATKPDAGAVSLRKMGIV